MKYTFATRMRQAIEESGMTLKEIARRADTTSGALSQWQTEGGVNPENVKAHYVESICAAINIRPRWLLYGEPPMRPNGESPVLAVVAPTREGYLRVEQAGEAEMGDGRENDDNPDIIRTVEYSEAFIRSLVGFLPPPGRLRLVTGRGDSMLPTIQPGDVVLVDTGIQCFDGDGMYLINTGGGQQIKLLQHRGDAVYVVSANPIYPAFPWPLGGIVGGKVYLKNKIERFN